MQLQEKQRAREKETLLRKQEKPLQGRESVHLRQEKDLEENLQEELPEEDARSLPLFFINIWYELLTVIISEFFFIHL